ncbi:hypothetical protein E3V08_02500 [Candidatus Atribacteria bacterium MT.SAG.1]|nr:hypothetical protein E3V08_02500 [Candidatus Atribacteria bacterium MT.SAG.1]
MAKLTKVEYRKIIWGLLKDYRHNKIKFLEELLEKIMAIPTPKEGDPYVGLATREDRTFAEEFDTVKQSRIS